MSTLLIVCSIYFAGVIIVPVWDAFFGLGYEFDGGEQPPLAVVATLWPISVPILFVALFCRFLEGVKGRRVDRERERIRIAHQRVDDAHFREAEKEVDDVLINKFKALEDEETEEILSNYKAVG
jgi:hypothetical protein